VVLSHGDYYLPNVLFDGTKITGMIDFGYVGYFPKERDISALIKSLVYNYGENPNYLLWVEQTLHETFNPNIIEYFMLYDELI
jgi:aminoglycoside phosphotransferase